MNMQRGNTREDTHALSESSSWLPFETVTLPLQRHQIVMQHNLKRDIQDA